MPKEKIKPYIVFLEFPNRRAEYWQVIKDINNVLEIKINSLTLGRCFYYFGNTALFHLVKLKVMLMSIFLVLGKTLANLVNRTIYPNLII